MNFDRVGIPTDDLKPPFNSEQLRQRTGEAEMTPEFNPSKPAFWCDYCPTVPHRTDVLGKPCPVCQGANR